MLVIDAELAIRGKRPESLEEAFMIAERMELHARKVRPEGKDEFESKIKDLVKPGNLF